MEQPPGYIESWFLDYVCCLIKDLYRLKQAPRSWFTQFNDYLTRLGFHCSELDTSLFVYSHDTILIYFLLYVDDIIVIDDDSTFLHNFIKQTDKEFLIKDLGRLIYFLGWK